MNGIRYIPPQDPERIRESLKRLESLHDALGWYASVCSAAADDHTRKLRRIIARNITTTERALRALHYSDPSTNRRQYDPL
jgi:hypothetical protein